MSDWRHELPTVRLVYFQTVAALVKLALGLLNTSSAL